MYKSFYLILLLIAAAVGSQAQKLPFPHTSASIDSKTLPQEIATLAKKVIKSYKSKSSRGRYLFHLSKLQLAIGDYANAKKSLDEAKALHKGNNPYFAALAWMPHALYAEAKSSTKPFEKAFEKAFYKEYQKLNRKIIPWVKSYLTKDVNTVRNQWQRSWTQHKDKDSLSIRSAIWFFHSYVDYQVCKAIVPILKPLLAAEDAKRYSFDDSVMIKVRDGAYISAVVARPKNLKTPKATIFFFNIYAEGKEDNYNFRVAKEAAARGYVGVVAFPRGKRYSSGKVIPYERDGKDAYDVIDWISKQSWSNGKVGMYGGSYCGFTQWAAAKKLHPALKTIVPSAAAAPGVDVPMENNVFLNFVYNWVPYTGNNRYLDYDAYHDRKRWNKLWDKWYESGKPYKDLDKIDGQPNKIFRRWLAHPSYDKYWQAMIPYQKDFAQINIPVLSTTGYYDGGQISSIYYLKEHYKYNKNANHYFLIGPWGHFGCQGFPSASMSGYKVDEVANIDIHEIIYQWFDYTLKGGKKPALLKDRINYQIMGANRWGHAPSLDKMGNQTLKFYLNNARSGIKFTSAYDGEKEFYTLGAKKPKDKGHVTQKVDFADRNPGNQNNYFSRTIINKNLTIGNGIAFASKPFEEAMIVSTFVGNLKVTINKKDMDCSIVLYEQTPEGEFFKLSNRYVGRASYARNRHKRELLIPGKATSIPVTNTRMTARKFSKGSRLVMVLNINKHKHDQVNYGSGKDVSNENIKEDAKVPLEVQWHNQGFIEVKVKKFKGGL